MKRTKKPIVDKNRKIKHVIYERGSNLEYNLKTLIKKMEDVISYVEGLGEDVHTEPYVQYERYGYDGGMDINIRYDIYSETVQEWKDRVEDEEKALKDWVEAETKAKIKKLEADLKRLKGERL